MTEPSELPAPERYPFWGYRELVMLVSFAFLLFIGVNGIFGLVFRPKSVSAIQALIVTFVFEGLWFVMLYAVIHVGYNRPFWKSLGWVPNPAGFWPCLGWGILAAAFAVALGSILPRPHGVSPMEELLQGRVSIILVGIFAVTLGPLCEELAFRGFLMPLLVRTFGVIGGIALQAVPFAVLHGMEYAWAWQQLMVMFFAGSVFGWMRHKTGSTAASTYMHAGYNLVAVVGLFTQSYVH